MKRRFLRTIFLLSLASSVLYIGACSKDDDPGQEQTELPSNETEARQRISGKWNVAASGEVRSIEFIEDGTYILETSAGLTGLASLKPSGRVASIGRQGATAPVVAQTNGTSGADFTQGGYTISADGKTITLGDLAVITITGLTENSFSFSITFTEGNRTLDITAAATDAVSDTQKTTLLAQAWAHTGWPSLSYLRQQEITYLTQAGFRPSDWRYTFTKSGTFIIRSVDLSGILYAPGSDEIETFSAEIYSEFGTWRWRDEQQTSVIITMDGESGEATIDDLTDTTLRLILGGSVLSLTKLDL